jgi:hypothetical protein
MSGWIKLHRTLKNWQWYDDHNATRLLIHLLISVNYEPKMWKGEVINSGEMAFSLANLSREIGLSEQQTRTAINKLQTSGQITRRITNKYQVVTLVKWEQLQDCESTDNNQITNKTRLKQQSNNNQTPTQITTTKEIKNKEHTHQEAGVGIPNLQNGIPKLNTEPASKFPEYLYRTRDKICETLNVSELKSMQSYKSITYFCEEIFRQGKIEQLEEVAKYYPMYRQASGMKAHKPQNFTGDPNLNYEDGAWCESDWKLKYNEHQTANQPKSTMSFFPIPKPEHQ